MKFLKGIFMQYASFERKYPTDDLDIMMPAF
jgi:hypothetical protein